METNWYRIFPAKILTVLGCLPGALRPDFSLLIWVYLNEGGLPDNDGKIAFLSGLPVERIQALNPCVEFIGRREDGKLKIDFLEEIIAERKEFAEKKAAAGAKGGTAKARKAKQSLAVLSSAKQSLAESSMPVAEASQACMHACSEIDKSISAADAAPEPVKSPDVIWDLGVNLLTRSGDKEPQARSFLGKLIKDHGKDSVATAVATTSAANPANPKEYLVKALQNGHKKYPARVPDDVNAGGRGRLVQ